MPTSRAFKIITHLSEAASLEEELFIEKDTEYTTMFKRDFSDEEQYIRKMGILDNQPKPDTSTSSSNIKETLLKSLYKKLAYKTHPDIYPDSVDVFRKIQEAYEKKDGPGLLTASLNHGIEIEVEADDIKDMMSDISRRRAQIENRKNTYCWVWGESDKSRQTKKYIRAALQIDEDKFQEWLSLKKPA